MYTDDRNAYRQTFFMAWDKFKKKLPLEPIEAQLIEVMLQHPEYHQLLDQPQKFQSQEFALEENPFFHMSLHISIAEQLKYNRPHGIQDVYQQLLSQHEDTHTVIHIMMECLAQTMWEAQQQGTAPDENTYLDKLRSR